MRVFFCFIILIILVSACRRHDCFDFPEPTVFQLVDTSGNNVIANGTLPFSDILIDEDAGNGTFTRMHYDLIDNNQLAIKELGWYNGTKNYRFWTPDTTFNFSVQSSKNESSGCDDSYKIDSISFTNITASKKTNFYQITIR